MRSKYVQEWDVQEGQRFISWSCIRFLKLKKKKKGRKKCLLLLWCDEHLAPLHFRPWFISRRSATRAWGYITAIPHAQAWESIIWGSRMLNDATTHGRIHASSLQSDSLLKLTQNSGSSRLKHKTSRAWSSVRLSAALISLSSNVPFGLSGALLGMFTSSRSAYVSIKHKS